MDFGSNYSFFFTKSFCTQVNGSVICNPYLQHKLVYIYEKLYLLHRKRVWGLHRSPLITPCQRVVGDPCQHCGFPSCMPPPQCRVLIISAPGSCRGSVLSWFLHLVSRLWLGCSVSLHLRLHSAVDIVLVVTVASVVTQPCCCCQHGPAGSACEATRWKHTLYLST